MPVIKQLAIAEAERQLKMNLSLIEMPKGNTDLKTIARFRKSWVEPIQELIRQMQGVNIAQSFLVDIPRNSMEIAKVIRWRVSKLLSL